MKGWQHKSMTDGVCAACGSDGADFSTRAKVRLGNSPEDTYANPPLVCEMRVCEECTHDPGVWEKLYQACAAELENAGASGGKPLVRLYRH